MQHAKCADDICEVIREADSNHPNWVDGQLLYATVIEIQDLIYDNGGVRGLQKILKCLKRVIIGMCFAQRRRVLAQSAGVAAAILHSIA